MKRQIILCFLFSFSFFITVQAQETTAVRQPDATTIQKQRDGEVLGFQYSLRRFETALKEKDQQSVIDLKGDLVTAMAKRVALMETEYSSDKSQKDQLNKQKEILKTIKEYSFSNIDKNQDEAITYLRKLQQFAILMESNFETH